MSILVKLAVKLSFTFSIDIVLTGGVYMILSSLIVGCSALWGGSLLNNETKYHN